MISLYNIFYGHIMLIVTSLLMIIETIYFYTFFNAKIIQILSLIILSILSGYIWYNFYNNIELIEHRTLINYIAIGSVPFIFNLISLFEYHNFSGDIFGYSIASILVFYILSSMMLFRRIMMCV